jgi:class 3 adenylate cyclase
MAPEIPAATRFTSPESYIPKHLAEKILTSKSALEGERKQVTVLFADLKGSMELLANRDPEEARKLLDPVLERMMEAVHRYEGTVRRSHAAVVKIRVGLNSGEVVVRAIGSDLHMDYTAVGQTTHLAARMEQIADPVTISTGKRWLVLLAFFIASWPCASRDRKGVLSPVRITIHKGLSGSPKVTRPCAWSLIVSWCTL